MGIVLSLYDFTGEALKPWADAGHECYAFDIQHDPHEITKEYYHRIGNGSIEYHHADLHDPQSFVDIKRNIPFMGQPVIFGMAFPVCTDLAVSGAAWFQEKSRGQPMVSRRGC